MKTWRLITAVLALVLLLTDQPAADLTTEQSVESPVETAVAETVVEPSVETPVVESLPGQFQIEDVPFIPQAPLKIWDALHEDACEEASLLTLYYWSQQQQPAASEIETALQRFIAWQTAVGYGPSITLSDLARAAQGYWSESWGQTLTVVDDAQPDDLRRELAAGYPVVIGAAGKLLENPHFKNGGPNYHMLVLIGYDESGFVTNDPGTQYGAGFRYESSTLLNAWHDWNEVDITRGTHSYLVLR